MNYMDVFPRWLWLWGKTRKTLPKFFYSSESRAVSTGYCIVFCWGLLWLWACSIMNQCKQIMHETGHGIALPEIKVSTGSSPYKRG